MFHSYFAKSAEMLYGLALIISGQITAKLLSFSFGILILLAIISFGKRFFSLETGIIAAALFYACPLVDWISTTTDVDLAVTFYIFCAVFSLSIWWKTGEKGFLLLCSLM
jgi:4-amino-4-deoxy-L-arabinose transferase-like glycosyltransferase